MTARRTLPALVGIALTLAVASCAAPGASISPTPGASSASVVPIPSQPVGEVPAGTIAFNRVGADGVEHYFTIRTDGTDEQSLFSVGGCSCIRWSPDGSQIWTLSETEHGTFAFMTMLPDGSNSTVITPPIETLNLFPGAATPDGSQIAFQGWDETDPANIGLWVASPDLSDLRQVTPQPDGVISLEPLGFAPDGSHILFFGETGSRDYVTHAGDLFVVNADGSDLRQLNPGNLSLSMVRGLPASLSPDGQRATFAAFEGAPDDAQSAVFVVDIAGGEAEQITDSTGGVWSAVWAPVGERITFAQWWPDGSVLSVINADGTDRRDLNPAGANDVGFGSWSPGADYLVASRGPESRRDLWIVDLDGNFIAQVTDSPADYAIYTWAPR